MPASRPGASSRWPGPRAPFCGLRLLRADTLAGSAACRVTPRQSPPRGTALVPRLGGTAGSSLPGRDKLTPAEPPQRRRLRLRPLWRPPIRSRSFVAPAATPRRPPGRKLRYRPRSPSRAARKSLACPLEKPPRGGPPKAGPGPSFRGLRLLRADTLAGSAACRVTPRQSPPRGTALVPRLGGNAGAPLPGRDKLTPAEPPQRRRSRTRPLWRPPIWKSLACRAQILLLPYFGLSFVALYYRKYIIVLECLHQHNQTSICLHNA